jgi:hypothetical protein
MCQLVHAINVAGNEVERIYHLVGVICFHGRHYFTYCSGVTRLKITRRQLRAMASAGARAYMGVWGPCPQWGPGAKPLVRGALPPEAEAFFAVTVGIFY